MRERRVEKSVDVEIGGYETVVSLVVLPDRLPHLFQFILERVVCLPLISRIRVPDQAHAPHLWGQKHFGRIALPSLRSAMSVACRRSILLVGIPRRICFFVRLVVKQGLSSLSQLDAQIFQAGI